MKVFEIHRDGKFTRIFRETLAEAKQAAEPFIAEGGAITIEHYCNPAPLAKWRHDAEVSDWVITQ